MVDKFEEEVSCYFDECAADGIFDTFSSDDLVKLQALLGIWEIQPGQSILGSVPIVCGN